MKNSNEFPFHKARRLTPGEVEKKRRAKRGSNAKFLKAMDRVEKNKPEAKDKLL